MAELPLLGQETPTYCLISLSHQDPHPLQSPKRRLKVKRFLIKATQSFGKEVSSLANGVQKTGNSQNWLVPTSPRMQCGRYLEKKGL